MGLVHGELTALLWGGAFAFVWAYATTARLVAGVPLGVRRPRGVLEVLPGPVLRFRTEAAPRAPAFFTWSLVLEGRHSAARTWERRLPLLSELLWPVEAPRGRYQVRARWELRDTFGFVRLSPRARWEATVVVPPQSDGFVPPAPPPTRLGPWRPRRTGRRAGDPFDVRRYHPGDDLRRLHWALFAHSGVPFVRTADPSPPPGGHQFLVLDTEAPSEEVLDRRLNRVTAWVETLLAQGTHWTLAVPAFGLTLTPRDSWKEQLAGLSPALLPAGAPDPSWPPVVTLITGRDGTGARAWGQGWTGRRRFEPFYVDAVSDPAPVTPWWRRPR